MLKCPNCLQLQVNSMTGETGKEHNPDFLFSTTIASSFAKFKFEVTKDLQANVDKWWNWVYLVADQP